jgi:hypothetical protein
VIVVAGKEMAGRRYGVVPRGTETNGVQWSKDLTGIFRETLILLLQLRWLIDVNLGDWRLGGKTKLRKGVYHRDFYEEREG